MEEVAEVTEVASLSEVEAVIPDDGGENLEKQENPEETNNIDNAKAWKNI